MAAVFLAAHLPFLPRSLDDIDSMNFALGVRSFDPLRHQPHPPGYPVYIALGKLSALVIRNEAARLAVWSAIFGALALIPLGFLFRAVDALDDRPGGPARPLMAVMVAACCPLFWLMAVRPLSDMPGLGLALVAQALLASAFLAQRSAAPAQATRDTASQSGRLVVLGSLAAAIAIVARSQAGWLTLPLLVLVLLDRTGRDAAGAWLGSAMSFVLGVTLWAVPLVIASGGVRRYVAAVVNMASEDLTGVDMLATRPGLRPLAFAVLDTLVKPWGRPSLAVVALLLAAIGFAVMALRDRRGLLVLVVAWGPYAVFHLLFQETLTVRYALPLILPIAYLLTCSLASVGDRPMVLAAGLISVAGLAIGAPTVKVYAASLSPAARAIADVDRGAPGSMLGIHQVFARAALIAGRNSDTTLAAPVGHEWLEVVRYFSNGDRGPLLFLADPHRTDLALIDPHSRQTIGSYRWPEALDALMSGTRPAGVDLIRIDRPGWLLERGWALTPEIAGITHQDAAIEPAAGLVTRIQGAAVLMIGGRHLGVAGDPDVRMDVIVDGRSLHNLLVKPGTFFFWMVSLSPGSFAGAGSYGRLAVAATPADGSRRVVRASIEQFDLQPADRLVFGYEKGWNEPEYDRSTGRLWRWSTDRATVAVHGSGPFTLRLSGESPLKSFARPSRVTIRAGGRTLAQESLASDFDISVPIPSTVFTGSEGHLSIETDQSFVPAERSGSLDRRRLGLKIERLEIR